jgi:plastocyanin
MYKGRRLWLVAAVAPMVVLATLATASSRVYAAAQTLTIGVDNAPPAGHNWEFLDFFPHSGVNVHNGDTLHFVFNTASPDGFHSVVFGRSGESAATIAINLPNLVPDASTGDAAGAKRFQAFFGTQPPPGSGAPGACGDVTTPCIYDNTKELGSGALVGPTLQFYFKIQLAAAPGAPVVINYICNVHGAAMNGTFSIVPNAAVASTQAQLDTAAAAQYAADVAAGQAVESSVAGAAVTTNPDGTHLISMTAGAETPGGRVQILEMLPGTVNIKPGDSVKWTTPAQNDPHTVTFPQGAASLPVDPFPSACEGASGDVPPSAGPPTFGCAGAPGSPTGLEIGFAPNPAGPTDITSPSTLASSGVLDAGAYFGAAPTSYTFRFPASGTFAYQCRIHDHMTGFVLAAATTVPVPPTGGAGGSGHNASFGGALVSLGVIVILGSALLFRRRRA